MLRSDWATDVKIFVEVRTSVEVRSGVEIKPETNVKSVVGVRQFWCGSRGLTMLLC